MTTLVVPPASAESLPDLPPARIANGVLTQDYPAVGALLQVDPLGAVRSVCTATLIGCETVLTAAHCFCGQDLRTTECIRSGKLEAERFRTAFALQHAGAFNIRSVAIHPDYAFPLTGDLAVLKLEAPVTGVPPARINTTAPVPIGSQGTIVGFGHTGPETDNGLKRRGTVSTTQCIDPRDNQLKEGLVCWLFDQPIGPPGGDSNTCEGDSGGPLFADLGAGLRVAGVTSGGTSSGCQPPDLSWDADVHRYRTWITQQAGADLNQTRCGSIPQLGEAGTQVRTYSGELWRDNLEDVYAIDIAAGTVELRFTLNGEERYAPSQLAINQFDLVVNAGAPAAGFDYLCWDDSSGPYGYCAFSNPTPTTWYVHAAWFEGSGTYQLTVTSFGSAGTPTRTFTPTPTPTRVITATRTPTKTRTPSPSRTPTRTRLPTSTPTRPRTSTATRPPTSTPTRPPTSSPTRTPTARATAVPSQTFTATRSAASTPTPSASSPPTRTATRTKTATVGPPPTLGPCYGDCDEDGHVTVSEIILAVTISADAAPASACEAADPNRNAAVTIDELVKAVNAALLGCRQLPTATATRTRTPSPKPSPTDLPSPTPTETEAPSPTPTEEPTQTPTYPDKATETPSETPTFSPTPAPTDTPTSTSTDTATATPTNGGPVFTFTPILTFTPVFSFTPIPPSTPTKAATATETATATATLTVTCPPTEAAPIILGRQNVPAGGYSLTGGSEIELAEMATTIEVQSECDEILASAVLSAASSSQECQFPGCTLRVRLSTAGAPDVMQTFGIRDANHLTRIELPATYSNLTPGSHAFRIFVQRGGYSTYTFIPNGYLEISTR